MFAERSVADFGLQATADVLTRAFGDYLVSVSFTASSLMSATRADSIDLAASRVLLRDGQPVAAALVARRGWTSRLAGMAVVPEARRLGAGRELMVRLQTEAIARGERAMVLEVIEHNESALRLYESCRFERVRRLLGFEREKDASDATIRSPDLVEVDPRVVAEAVARHGSVELPWQRSAETVAHLHPPSIGYRCKDAWAVLANVESDRPTIRALAAPSPGDAIAILHAIIAENPTKAWRAGSIWSEDWSAVFENAGFSRSPISQWQMELRF